MPGISVSRIPIPFNKGGFSYSSYWATRKPTLLIVTGMRDTEIDFSWTDNSAGEASFKVYKSTDKGVTYTAAGTTVAGVTTYTATGLTAGVEYYFYVVGVKSANESDPTNIYDTRFKITVDTTKAGSANDTYILPTTGAGYDAYVDWGDGSAEQNITGTPGNVTHDYNQTGTFQIKIRGTFPRIYVGNAGDKLKLTSIDNWGNIKWGSLGGAFNGASNMTGTYIDVPNLSAVTTLQNAFASTNSFNAPIRNWSIPEVTDARNFITLSAAFNSEVSFINANKLANGGYMLSSLTKFNQPINFNFPALTTAERMFSGNTSQNSTVTITAPLLANTNSMFASCAAFKQFVDLNVESLTDATNMFSNVTLPSDVYEDILVDWAAQDVNDAVPFHGGNSYLLYGSDGLTARSHLIDTHSWTFSDYGHTFDNGKIVFTYDGGWASQFSGVYPILTSEAVKGTFYITTDLVGEAGYVTWANLQTLAGAGHDIQCHTKTHTSFISLTDLQITAELNAVNDAFVANSLTSPVHTAYPNGDVTAAQMLVVATLRSTGRSITEVAMTSSPNYMGLPSPSIDAKSVAAIKALIDEAKLNSKAYIFYQHQLDASGYLTSAQLTEVIQYAKTEGLDILTISELYALLD